MLGGQFSFTISPEAVTGEKVPTLTGKGKPTSKCVFHHDFSLGQILGDLVCLQKSWILWGHTLSVNLDTKPWWQNLHFSLGGPKVVWLSNFWQIHPISAYLLLTVLALIYPLEIL